MQTRHNNDDATLEADVRNIVGQGDDVQEKVRQLTLRMLSSRSLDISSVRQVSEAVLRGAQAGMHEKMQHTSDQYHIAYDRLKQVVSGLDVALAQFAEAAKLAVEEAAGRAQKYSSHDLKRARSDIEGLEKMFVETLQNAAASTKDTTREIFDGLLQHVRTNGSAIGEQLNDTLSVFSGQLAATGRAQTDVGLHLARNTAHLMRQIAAGVLIGVADRIRPHHSPHKGR